MIIVQVTVVSKPAAIGDQLTENLSLPPCIEGPGQLLWCWRLPDRTFYFHGLINKISLLLGDQNSYAEIQCHSW
jgi:hypothetical protein